MTTFFSTLQRPRQSFEFAGLEEVSVQQNKSIFLAQRLNGVIRQGILCWLASHTLFFPTDKCHLPTDVGLTHSYETVPMKLCRQDTSTGFSYEECKKGASGGILLERLLPEIAYKLGRAHKYGA